MDHAHGRHGALYRSWPHLPQTSLDLRHPWPTLTGEKTTAFDRLMRSSVPCKPKAFVDAGSRADMPNLDRSLIQALPVFSAMGDAELDDVIAHATARRIPKGIAVFRQGEIARAFFVLLHGRLKVVKVTP